MGKFARFSPFKKFVRSYSIIPNGLLKLKVKGVDLSIAKLIWARMSQYCWRKDYCYPSVKQLSEELGVSEHAIKDGLKKLVKLELIEIERPSGEDRLMHRRNRYYMLDNPLLYEIQDDLEEKEAWEETGSWMDEEGEDGIQLSGETYKDSSRDPLGLSRGPQTVSPTKKGKSLKTGEEKKEVKGEAPFTEATASFSRVSPEPTRALPFEPTLRGKTLGSAQTQDREGKVTSISDIESIIEVLDLNEEDPGEIWNNLDLEDLGLDREDDWPTFYDVWTKTLRGQERRSA